jgi:hypothetical protein
MYYKHYIKDGFYRLLFVINIISLTVIYIKNATNKAAKNPYIYNDTSSGIELFVMYSQESKAI